MLHHCARRLVTRLTAAQRAVGPRQDGAYALARIVLAIHHFASPRAVSVVSILQIPPY